MDCFVRVENVIGIFNDFNFFMQRIETNYAVHYYFGEEGKRQDLTKQKRPYVKKLIVLLTFFFALQTVIIAAGLAQHGKLLRVGDIIN